MRTLIPLVLTFLLSSSAWAQSIAVVALDESPETRKTAAHIAQMLISNGKSASFGEPVTNSLRSHRVPPNNANVGRFLDFNERVEAGTELFYYSGESKALAALTPLFRLGLSHFAYVANSPGLSAAHFETGILMVRSYDALKRSADAMATAKLVARHYPAREPSLETTPPKIIELIRQARTELFAEEAKLGIAPIGGENCVGLLNGTPVGDGLFAVPADTQLYVQVRCGEQTSALMTLKLPPGKQVMAPVPLEAVEDQRMADDSFKSRRRAEQRLRILQFWGNYATVVGVRTPERPNGQAPTLFAHLEDGTVTWTETVGVPAFVGFVESAFALEIDDSTTSPPVDWLGWSLVGGGALLAGGGATLYILGRGDRQAIICSGYATEKADESECVGVSDLGDLSEAEFDSAVSSADLKLVMGATFVGVGLAAATWGIVRLVYPEDDSSVSLLPTLDGVQVIGELGGKQW